MKTIHSLLATLLLVGSASCSSTPAPKMITQAFTEFPSGEWTQYIEAGDAEEDWDALLKSYDAYVTKYITFLKKAAQGDMSALSEYPALMQKAQELSEKLSQAQGDMSASQWKRYQEITNKMVKAISEMHKK